jgi:uncharacterized membrane protein YeiH
VASLGLGLPRAAAAGLGFAAALALRGAALQRGWSLPRYRPRPGRTPEEVRRLRDGEGP